MDIYRLPEKNYGYIYKYTSPSGKSYIGQTTTSLAKRSGKRGKGYLGCNVFYKAITKYGFDSFRVEILGEYPKEELNYWEEKFIYEQNTLTPNGYNVKAGGQNTTRVESPVYAYNLDGSFYKRYFNQADARKEFGVNGSDITKCLQGKLHYVKGKIWKNEYTERVEPVWTGKNGSKPVVKLDPITLEVLEIYPSASAAARALGLPRSSGISRCCRGETKISAGYKWKFFSQFND